MSDIRREAVASTRPAPVGVSRWPRLWTRVFDVLLAFTGVVVTFVWASQVVASDFASEQVSNTEVMWAYASLVGFVAGSTLHVAVHEVGHLLVAVALRFRVLSVRILSLWMGERDVTLPDTSGHVRVATPDPTRWLPLRMILFLSAGSAANIAVSMVVSFTVVADRSAAVGVRSLAVGFTVAGFYFAISSLVPKRLAGGAKADTDGRQIFQWIFRPHEAMAHDAPTWTPVGHRTHLASDGAHHPYPRRDHLVSAIASDEPDIAVAAMTALLRRPRRDDGWRDVDLVATFAARHDLPADVRAKVSSQYALSLALAHFAARDTRRGIDFDLSRVDRMDHLAGVALAANPDSLQAHTAAALVRVIQERPAEARALLEDVTASPSPVVLARALAVRGIAEMKLGHVDEARKLGEMAHQKSTADAVVTMLDALLRTDGVRKGPAEAG